MTTTDDLGFRFENGEPVDTVNLAHASHVWMLTFGSVVLDKQRPAPMCGAGDALAFGVVNAVGATLTSGGLPTNLYALVGGRHRVGLAPVDPHLLPEAAWCGLARAAYAHELRRTAEQEGARWVLNLAFEFGNVRSVDGESVREVEVDGEAPHLLLRVTAFDLADDVALRWWAKAAPTGDPERPVHLVPIDQPVGRREWGWLDHFSGALADETSTLGRLLGPVELLGRRDPTMETQVDLRAGAYADVVSGMRAIRSGAAVATLLSEACSDLRVRPEALVGTLVGWGGHDIVRALEAGINVLAQAEGLTPSDDEGDAPVGRGMRA